jgi:hypothetical protein
MKYVAMACGFAHKGMTSMKWRGNGCWEEVVVTKQTIHPQLGRCLIGMFVCGIGAFNVHFPELDIRPATEEEQAALRQIKYGHTFAAYKSTISDEGEFATQADLDNLPTVEWNKL